MSEEPDIEVVQVPSLFPDLSEQAAALDAVLHKMLTPETYERLQAAEREAANKILFGL